MAVVFGTVAVRTLVVVVANAAVRLPTTVVAMCVTAVGVAVYAPTIVVVHMLVFAVVGTTVVGTAVAERVRLPAAGTVAAVVVAAGD